MPYIIDGHNLIPKVRGINLKDIDDEQQLIEMLQEFGRKQEKNVEVFFDNAQIGAKQIIKTGRVTARFVPSTSTADQAIRRRLKQIGPGARNYWVVSSDAGVQRSAREFHARPLSSEDFSILLLDTLKSQPSAKDESVNISLGADEVQEWLDIFKKKM
jgi:uncharacterized protein